MIFVPPRSPGFETQSNESKCRGIFKSGSAKSICHMGRVQAQSKSHNHRNLHLVWLEWQHNISYKKKCLTVFVNSEICVKILFKSI